MHTISFILLLIAAICFALEAHLTRSLLALGLCLWVMVPLLAVLGVR